MCLRLSFLWRAIYQRIVVQFLIKTAPKCNKDIVNASCYIQLHTIIDRLKITQNFMEGESKKQSKS